MTDTTATSLAPWALRVRAMLLDLCWVLPGAALFGIALFMQSGLRGQPALRFLIWQVGTTLMFAGWAYTRWYLGSKGATWGKQRTGLRVVDAASGEGIDIMRTVIRDMAHLSDALPFGLGFLWPLWDSERTTFADKIAKTRVRLHS